MGINTGVQVKTAPTCSNMHASWYAYVLGAVSEHGHAVRHLLQEAQRLLYSEKDEGVFSKLIYYRRGVG
jgi:hypothetical protein